MLLFYLKEKKKETASEKEASGTGWTCLFFIWPRLVVASPLCNYYTCYRRVRLHSEGLWLIYGSGSWLNGTCQDDVCISWGPVLPFDWGDIRSEATESELVMGVETQGGKGQNFGGTMSLEKENIWFAGCSKTFERPKHEIRKRWNNVLLGIDIGQLKGTLQNW